MDYEYAQRLKGIFFNDKSPGHLEMGYVKESTRYDIDPQKDNLALIIINKKFDKSLEVAERKGADEDTSAIRKALLTLKFKVNIEENLPVKKMKEAFQKIKEDKKNLNCFVCVISSHGERDNMIYGTDKKVHLDDLVEELLPDKCPSLAGIPKLFFIQACRGKRMDEGARQNDTIKAGRIDDEDIIIHTIPVWVDVLVAYSTVSEFCSWRNAESGSWFLQSLAGILEEYGKELELQELMLLVNRRIASKETDMKREKKQISCIASTLTKELYFIK